MYFHPHVVPVMNSVAKFVLFTQRAWKSEGLISSNDLIS